MDTLQQQGGRGKKTAATRKVKPTRKTTAQKKAVAAKKAAATSRMDSDSRRVNRFNKCMRYETTEDPFGKQHIRYEVPGLNGVTYGGRLTDAELASLWDHLKNKHDITTVNKAFTRKGLEACHAALCRWPRPSELGRIAAKRGEKVKYFLCKVPVEGDISKLVGREGIFLIQMCEEYDLLYAWVKGGKLWIYARTEDAAIAPTVHSDHLREFMTGSPSDVTELSPKVTERTLGTRSGAW